MDARKLQIQQLDSKIKAFRSLKNIIPPNTGWIKAIRLALGMSLNQLSNRLGITRQSALEIEQREKKMTISLKLLKETADALDMELVYGFIPRDGSLKKLVDRKALHLATEIVLRTSNTMELEEQGNSEQRIKRAIKERTEILKNEMPKILWD